LIVCYISRGIDIRNHGSGSTGATNVLRTLGLPLAVIVIILDVSKAIIAIYISSFLIEGESLIKAIAAIFVMIGHIWPIYARFRGGKGILTGVVGLIVLSPIAGVTALVLALLTIAIFKIVSLGSIVGILAGLIFILVLYAIGQEQNLAYVIYAAVGSTIVIFRHIRNIQRLIDRTEPTIGNRANKTKP
jgi:glycerol-3-phosphate acyltransferase PlsY